MRGAKLVVLLTCCIQTLAWAAQRGGGAQGRNAGETVHWGPAELQGTWWASEYHPRIPIVGGGEPPLNAAGKAAYEVNRAGLRDSSIEDATRTYCLPDAVPRLAATPYPFELFQLPPGQVTFVHELNQQVRVIGLDVALPSLESVLATPTYEGYSSGTYQGDTLVIRSLGFNGETFIDSTGLPHSDKLVTTERIRRVGEQLEDVISIHDPEYYTGDWQARFVYARQPREFRLQEYVCGEPHRDISMIKGISEVRAARAKGQFP